MALTFLLVAIGGAIGAVARFGVAQIGHRMMTDAAPAATLAVNLSGCLAIGFLACAFAGPWSGLREEARTALVVGVLGGLTTFSAFGWETFRMLEEGLWARAAAFSLGQVAVGVAAVVAGAALARRWLAG